MNPNSGETNWTLLSRVNIPAFNASLKDFAETVNAGNKKQIILVIDRAGWHNSKDVVVPNGIHLEFLPSHSPELQPAEKLWSLTDEPLVNKCFKNIKEMMNTLSERCLILSSLKDIVKGKVHFSWWPKEIYS